MNRIAIGIAPHWARRGYLLALVVLGLGLGACQQKMAQAPYYRTQEETTFFPDGRSARPLEEGVVARGQLATDSPLMTGLTADGRKRRLKKPEFAGDAPQYIEPGAADDPKYFVDTFPFKLTIDDVHRGQERYTIFCTPCHNSLGDGRGKIVERGNLKPPSYHVDPSRGFQRFSANDPEKVGKPPLLLKDAPVGYYFEVISRGFGAMPDHAAQIPPADRWRIIAYIRTLQLSQSTTLSELPEEQQRAAREALGSKQP